MTSFAGFGTTTHLSTIFLMGLKVFWAVVEASKTCSQFGLQQQENMSVQGYSSSETFAAT
jgi:hypothetical protein